jgi:hypothetical protein
VRIEWDVTPPTDRKDDATAMQAVAIAITTLADALAARGLELNVSELVNRFGIPVTGKKITPPKDATPDDNADESRDAA